MTCTIFFAAFHRKMLVAFAVYHRIIAIKKNNREPNNTSAGYSLNMQTWKWLDYVAYTNKIATLWFVTLGLQRWHLVSCSRHAVPFPLFDRTETGLIETSRDHRRASWKLSSVWIVKTEKKKIKGTEWFKKQVSVGVNQKHFGSFRRHNFISSILKTWLLNLGSIHLSSSFTGL